jgi:hypothetical protein
MRAHPCAAGCCRSCRLDGPWLERTDMSSESRAAYSVVSVTKHSPAARLRSQVTVAEPGPTESTLLKGMPSLSYSLERRPWPPSTAARRASPRRRSDFRHMPHV